MPAKSVTQRRFMGMVHAAQSGELDNPSSEVQKAAMSMSAKQSKDFASTPEKDLPAHAAASNARRAQRKAEAKNDEGIYSRHMARKKGKGKGQR